ncbi:hypothetical protein FNV43_RR03568 [Rhamnella rubrinervis]|uniref:TIR domain-containing protein n=1 Tax=Rhamnella rubrinervis TaxID=2594499 RepID=A0A8K0HK85_9ROSA|nr:hypothetical protein FNV43_RR03568 [Rhamnella rubrinervis]
MASSPFSSAVEEKRYDVFLSFRGEDTRNRFATSLYRALHEKQILAFMDHRLRRGDEIAPALRKTIDESVISVVIFSGNYATSTWCLDELVHVLECKKRNGMIVMPIFYGVEPSVVRKQEGSYEVAFAKLEERFKDRMKKVLQWRDALAEAANLCGLASKDFRFEDQLIKKIVEDVLLELPKYSLWNIEHCKGRLFAIQERMEILVNLLDIECSTDVRIVGIWGMGGIGKTTLASAVFQRLSYSHFEGCSYLWNVRQEYENFGPNNLRKKLLTQLFNNEDALISMDTPFVGSPFIQDRLRRKKVLIVLDDVDSSVQLETLLEGYNQLAPGSRIIITSRNKQVLVKVADGIYKVKGLNYTESLKLFHLHAFGRNSYPTEYYETLSNRVTSYANGNPLALKVLGSFLNSRSEGEWESALRKLERVPNNDILKVLRISYEGLDDEGIKNIFLDITCFFDASFTREYAESMLDGGDSSAKIGISVLFEKSLIEYYHEDKTRFRMHDLIKQMGWSIVSDEHKRPENRTRLRDIYDVCNVLEKNMGSASIEVILLDLSEMKRDVKISPAAFSKMCNLRFLKIYCDKIYSEKFKLYLPRGLESFFSNELRYFQWDFYPLESLPSDFTPENLVELILRRSHLKQLENHVVKSLPKLKKMDLSNSKLLTRIADLSQAPNLESINLEGCISLFHVLSSVQNLHKLTYLNLSGCNKLSDLAELSGRRGHLDIVKNLLNNICHLNFTLLTSSITGLITNFPLHSSSSNISLIFPMNLTSLNLSETTIEEVPSSACCLPHLQTLDLHCCGKLKGLSTRICKLKSLQFMNLGECSSLEEFPEFLEPMEHLTFLVLSGAAIKKLPQSIENLIGLTSLVITDCKGIEYLPNNLCKLILLVALNLDNCSKLQTLPPCPLGLNYLNISHCERLKLIEELPPNLIDLDARQCTSLETISSQTNKSYLMVGVGLKLDNCSKLDQNTHNFVVNGVIFWMFRATSHEYNNPFEPVYSEENFCSCYPGDEIPNQFSHQTKVDANAAVYINYEIDDGQAGRHACMSLGEAEIKLDHVLMWYSTKDGDGRNWLTTCSSEDTKVSFNVWPSFCSACEFVELGSDYCKIKKCGIRLVYENDLE